MAGHSKWAKLKHVKGKTDAQKAKLFGKLVRFISVEMKKSKGDAASYEVRAAVEKARAYNVPSENIKKALGKASSGDSNIEKVIYEAYGPGGAAIVIDGYTDNRNRTAQEIKYLLSKYGGALANPGAAIWTFQENAGALEPIYSVDLASEDMRKLADLVDALEDHDDVNEIYTNAV
jgi:YebC/PmpR family DNA-binding regulatory protein